MTVSVHFNFFLVTAFVFSSSNFNGKNEEYWIFQGAGDLHERTDDIPNQIVAAYRDSYAT